MAIINLSASEYTNLCTVKGQCDQVYAQNWEQSLIHFQDNTVLENINTLLKIASEQFLGHLISIKKCAENNNYKNATDNLNTLISNIKTDTMYIYTEVCEKIKTASNTVFNEQLELYTAAAKAAEEKIAEMDALRERYISNRTSYNNIDLPAPTDPAYGGRQRQKAHYETSANNAAREFNQKISGLQGNVERMIHVLEQALIKTSAEGTSETIPSI